MKKAPGDHHTKGREPSPICKNDTILIMALISINA